MFNCMFKIVLSEEAAGKAAGNLKSKHIKGLDRVISSVCDCII